MKTVYLLALALLISSVQLNAQVWDWTHPEPNGIAEDPNYNPETDAAFKVIADNSGNVYELGGYRDSLYLANKLQTAAPGNIIPRSFIAKYNSAGKLLWRILPQPLNAGTIQVTDMATSSQGIFITGIYVASY